MPKLRILPYNMTSESARDLAKYLNCLRVYPDRNFVPHPSHLIINWGCSTSPVWYRRGVKMLNKPAAVRVAANKLSTLTELRHAGIAVPDFTIEKHIAQNWVDNGEVVLERHTLTGNSGKGISMVRRDYDSAHMEIPIRTRLKPAPLYTKYIEKTREFRVHVLNGEVIDYIEKKKRRTRPDNFSPYVSSVHCGWIFARRGVVHSPNVTRSAIEAVTALGLEFGAVDVAYFNNLPFVLEVNTAPGLHGTTLVKYVNAFKRYIGAAPLSQSKINEIMSHAGITTHTSTAAVSASVSRDRETSNVTSAISTPPDVLVTAPLADDEVLLRLDKPTALKLKALLLQIA